jgi:hypothetical protein
VVLPVKRLAFSRMVSGLVSTPRILALAARIACFGALSAWAATAFTGCSNSQCLLEGCGTSLPDESAVGGSSNAGTSGMAGSAGQPSAGAPSTPSTHSCSSNSECPADKGQACVSGTCRVACTSHFDCLGLGECTSALDADGGSGHFCDLTRPRKPGQFYTHCATGTECDAANGFLCVGAGTDDTDAYCTTDCTDDSSCAAGYACTPLIRTPCENVCDLKGNARDHQCVPKAQIGEGKPFQCGARGVVRNVCRPRKFCSPCQSDDDCLAVANQVCAKDASGAKICTQRCDLKHPSCPWGNAAECGIWDTALNQPTCQHRFGSCIGDGKSCEPCLKDADCGKQGVCNSSSFTGERWCVDFSVSCSCGDSADASGLCAGGGCPETPGGLAMLCSDSTPSTPDSGFCAGAYTSSGLGSSPQTGCWPAN